MLTHMQPPVCPYLLSWTQTIDTFPTKFINVVQLDTEDYTAFRCAWL